MKSGGQAILIAPLHLAQGVDGRDQGPAMTAD